jgi:hypothetical protein
MGFRVASIVATASAAVAAATIQSACLTAEPPPLPSAPVVRPTIIHDLVQPGAGVPLRGWPSEGQFLVPVDVPQNQLFTWAVFVDYDPASPAQATRYSPPIPPPQGPVSFTLPEPTDGFCHRIDFLVSASTDATLYLSGDGDIVTWWYTGGNANCNPYSGPLPDGGFE